MKNYYIYKPGKYYIAIAEQNGFITNLEIAEDFPNFWITPDMIEKETSAIKKTLKEIDGYFNGTLKEFTVPILPDGTEFQKKVWNVLLEIPYGKTSAYKDVAIKIGNPKASRAVGNANNKNPIMIIIPCHRVIGSSGKLVGYRGGIDTKNQLLKMELKNSES